MLNTEEIKNLLFSDKRTKTSFRGISASDELPLTAPTSSLYNCNTDPSSQPGKHWIATYIDNKRKADFLDSFGMHPSVEHFETFLKNNSRHWTHSNKALQHPFFDACGYHCIFLSVYRCVGFDMNAIVNMYTNKLMCNDTIVKEFVREKMLMQ